MSMVLKFLNLLHVELTGEVVVNQVVIKELSLHPMLLFNLVFGLSYIYVSSMQLIKIYRMMVFFFRKSHIINI